MNMPWGDRVFALLTPIGIVLGCAALAARPPATFGGLAVTTAVGTIGVVGPLPLREESRPAGARWLAVAVLGVGAFVSARLLATLIPASVTPSALMATGLAAVAEEAFFRRLVYGWLARWGSAVAIAGAALAFAAVHVPAYGIRVLPLDVAAGILFGWQRWASGGWAAPALTHMVANLVQML